MEQFTTKEIITAVVSLIIAIVAGITIKNKMSKKNSVIQKGNKVGGDIAGRDINKK